VTDNNASKNTSNIKQENQTEKCFNDKKMNKQKTDIGKVNLKNKNSIIKDKDIDTKEKLNNNPSIDPEQEEKEAKLIILENNFIRDQIESSLSKTFFNEKLLISKNIRFQINANFKERYNLNYFCKECNNSLNADLNIIKNNKNNSNNILTENNNSITYSDYSKIEDREFNQEIDILKNILKKNLKLDLDNIGIIYFFDLYIYLYSKI